jgi:hypothetical protein
LHVRAKNPDGRAYSIEGVRFIIRELLSHFRETSTEPTMHQEAMTQFKQSLARAPDRQSRWAMVIAGSDSDPANGRRGK